jgi:predicted transcriptional regulator of viral defense system
VRVTEVADKDTNMTRTITHLGAGESKLLTTLAGDGRSLFTVEDAALIWQSREGARQALSRLEAKGWVDRLERGSYMIVPLEAGPDGQWTEDALTVGTFIVPDGAAAYWSAIRHWGWTTQLPQITQFLTPRRRTHMVTEALGMRYRFVYCAPTRLWGVACERRGSLEVRVTDRERTVVDMLHRTDLCGGVAEVASALAEAWHQLDQDRLTEYVRRFEDGTVPKRLGFLVEHLDLPTSQARLCQWKSLISTGYGRLDRRGPDSGPRQRRWALRLNESGFEANRP